METSVIIAIIAAIPGVVAAYIALRKSKTEIVKERGDAASTIQDAALELLEPYKQEVATLREHISKLETQVEDLKAKLAKMQLELDCVKTERNKVISGAYMLFHQVKAGGGTPVYTPPEYQGGQ